METAGIVRLPHVDDPLDADLREVDVAIEMVARGAAVRVRIVGMNAADAIAPIALARAQLAGVDFRIDRSSGATLLNFGPDD
jgi:hypothetical protein